MMPVRILTVILLLFSGCSIQQDIPPSTHKIETFGIAYPVFYKPFRTEYSQGLFGNSTNKNVQWLSFAKLHLGIADFHHAPLNAIADLDATIFESLQSSAQNSRYAIIWLTKEWEESWFDLDEVNAMVRQGKIPVFLHWYFGDDLVKRLPNLSEQKAYLKDIVRLSKVLKKINGVSYVILEPEFNKTLVLDHPKIFIPLFYTALNFLRQHNSSIRLSLCIMDTGSRSTRLTCHEQPCALADYDQWKRSGIILDPLIDLLDFVSFQQMVAQFSRNPITPGSYDAPIPIAFDDETSGIRQLPQRIINLTKFLHDRYHKPVFLPYMSIPTATWHDKNQNNVIEMHEIDEHGWEAQASRVYHDLATRKKELIANGLIGLGPMSVFDNPCQDYSGYRFFLKNEEYMGIVKFSGKVQPEPCTSVFTPMHGDIVPKGTILKSLDSLAGKLYRF